MLTIYRRHKRACSNRNAHEFTRVELQGDISLRVDSDPCRCPLWVDGSLHGEEIRKSLRTRNWRKAQNCVRGWEAEGKIEPQQNAESATIADACQRFEADAEARKLSAPTRYKYTLLFRQLKAFAERRGMRFLAELGVDTLTAFRSGWKDGPRSGLKKLERLRTFLRFCEQRKWIGSNPAAELKAPRIIVRPTLPFTSEEMLKILGDGLNKYVQEVGGKGRLNARRMRALVLVMRYSGLRIGDAVRLGADKLNGDRLFLYTAKTGTPVYTVLPDFVVNALEVTPRVTERFFFWSGTGKPESAVKVWETRLRRMFKLAGLRGAHSHQFRDSFAVELLLSGVPIERVSVLLGHQSVRITEHHYSPWTQSRQAQIEADLKRAWAQDPVALAETKGTQEVHGAGRVQ